MSDAFWNSSFWNSLPATIIATFAGVMGFLTWVRQGRAMKKLEVVAVQTDGLTKALVKSEKLVSHAEGVVEGVAQEKRANGPDKP